MGTEPAVRIGQPPPQYGYFRCGRSDLPAGVVRLALSGEVDLAVAGDLDEMIGAAETGAKTVVLDLDQLRFIDCSGARVLRAAGERARGNGHSLVAVNPPRHIERWMRLMAVDRSLTLVSPPDGTAPPPC